MKLSSGYKQYHIRDHNLTVCDQYEPNMVALIQTVATICYSLLAYIPWYILI